MLGCCYLIAWLNICAYKQLNRWVYNEVFFFINYKMCNQNHLHCDQWRRRSLSNVQLSLKPHLKVKGKVSSISTQGILCGCEGVCFLICKGQQRFSEVQKVLAAEREVKKYRRDERVQIWLVLPKWPKDSGDEREAVGWIKRSKSCLLISVASVTHGKLLTLCGWSWKTNP